MPTSAIRPVPAFYRVRMLLVQMATVIISVLVMLLLPLPLSAAALTLLYAGVLVRERRFAIVSPITGVLLIICLSILGLSILGDEGHYEAYVPLIFFGTMFTTGALLLILGRPATLAYGSPRGSLRLHWITSSVWVAVYLLGIAASLIMPHYPRYYVLMPLIPAMGVIATLWLHFIGMGKSGRRETSFSVGTYRFTQLQADATSLQPFYAQFIREALPAIRRGNGPRNESHSTLVALKMKADAEAWQHTVFFAAYAGDELIGTMSCAISQISGSLGFESGHSRPVTLDRLKRFGPVMEVGRFSIAASHRNGQDAIHGLMRCAVDYAFEKDVNFMVTQSYPSAESIYAKIGFKRSDEGVSHQATTGAAVRLLAFNLARRVVCDADDAELSHRLASGLHAYRAERYFKRQSLRSLFQRRPAWTLSDDEIARLIRPIPSVTSYSEPSTYAS